MGYVISSVRERDNDRPCRTWGKIGACLDPVNFADIPVKPSKKRIYRAVQ